MGCRIFSRHAWLAPALVWYRSILVTNGLLRIGTVAELSEAMSQSCCRAALGAEWIRWNLQE